MIYFGADDYGLCRSVSEHIRRCVDKGALNQVSSFANFEEIDFGKLIKDRNIRAPLHLNLVEGECMADAGSISLIADENGRFKHTFGGLLRLNLFRAKELETQLYIEIRAQVLFWKQILSKDAPFLIDSHQHTHMIPAVFRALMRVLRDENIIVQHMRIPSEPILPYLTTPSLYLTYNPVNLLKQWLLKFLWKLNKRQINREQIPTSLFMGILFSGKMDEKRVAKILPKYQKLAQKSGKDIEVLFHPGIADQKEISLQNKHIVFHKFYFSKNRTTEFDSVIKISERGAW